MTNLAPLTELLRAAHRLPAAQPHAPTLLEITGYERQERLSSNVLAFFLDPAQPHGLGTTLLEALLAAVGAEPLPAPAQVEVRTEVSTQAGKRLDILIETDTLILAIENKIDHEALNPFDEYRAELERLRKRRRWLGVLLAPRRIATSPAFCGFLPLTYADYFQTLERCLEAAPPTACEPYLTFLHDFIRTIRRISRETRMDPTTLAFLAEHQDDIPRLLEAVAVLRDDMKQKTSALRSLVDPSVCGLTVKAGFWRPAQRLSDALVYEVQARDDLSISVLVHLQPSGWHINLHPTNQDQPSLRQPVEAWLRERRIAVRPRDYPHVWRLGYGDEPFAAYDAPLAQIRDVVQELFRQFARLPQGE